MCEALKLTMSVGGSQATTYGKCILVDYNSVHQDMCVKEFMRLKDCVAVSSCVFFLILCWTLLLLLWLAPENAVGGWWLRDATLRCNGA